MAKILICDDEPDIRDMLGTLLELEFDEVQIDYAANGAEAIKKLKDHFQLIICDFNMPQGSGADVFVANKKNGNSPMIMMSGSEDLDQAFLNDFHASNESNSKLTKPWEDHIFLKEVRKIIA